MFSSVRLPVALRLRSPLFVFAVSIFLHSIPFALFAYTETNEVKMPSAIVILAEGAEEMEAVISIDVLRRGGVCYFFICSFWN